MLSGLRIPDPPMDVLKIQRLFQEIDHLVSQLLEKVGHIYRENGLKYFNKPTHDSLMRLLTPYQLKVFIDYGDICWLFQNRSQLMRVAMDKEAHFQKSASNPLYLNNPQMNLNFSADLDYHQIRDNKNEQSRPSQKMKLEPLHSNQNAIFKFTDEPKNIINQSWADVLSKKNTQSILKFSDKQSRIEQKLCSWVKWQNSIGRPVTRKDLKQKAYAEFKLGERRIRTLLRNNEEIRRLLTHANSNSIQTKKIDRSLNRKSQSMLEQSSSSQEAQEDSSSMYGISFGMKEPNQGEQRSRIQRGESGNQKDRLLRNIM